MSIQTILSAVQPELAAIIISAAVAGAGYLYQWGIQRLPTNAQKTINTLAHTAAQAIEQKYADTSPGGALKKQEAMNAVAAMCQEMGLRFNESSASAAIEATVYAMNLYRRFSAPATETSQETRPLPAMATTPAPEAGRSSAP
ncbi:MAG TPA: phage holin, LLH family [Ktedonobacteraceae bacterium]|nr:phage holin, LLH family [Ktedonobacteraceae bacterium]